MISSVSKCSTSDFYIQQFDFYIQQEICTFSNLKFVFSNMRFIFNNFRFAFNEMKFIKLKPFTFSKPNLDATKYTIKSIRQTEDLVCKLYIQSVSIFLALFERSLHITEMMFKSEVLFFFLLSYCSMNVCQELGLGGSGHMHVDVSQVFYMNITMHILLDEACSRICY